MLITMSTCTEALTLVAANLQTYQTISNTHQPMMTNSPLLDQSQKLQITCSIKYRLPPNAASAVQKPTLQQDAHCLALRQRVEGQISSTATSTTQDGQRC